MAGPTSRARAAALAVHLAACGAAALLVCFAPWVRIGERLALPGTSWAGGNVALAGLAASAALAGFALLAGLGRARDAERPLPRLWPAALGALLAAGAIGWTAVDLVSAGRTLAQIVDDAGVTREGGAPLALGWGPWASLAAAAVALGALAVASRAGRRA